MTPRAVLVGYRASGKTTFGRQLAGSLGLPFVDIDQVLTGRLGMAIVDFFARHGEEAFRDREEALLADLLNDRLETVLATGGGIVERPGNRLLLRQATCPVIYLHASAAVLSARLGRDAGGRPSLTGADVAAEVAAVLARRDPLYRMVANAEVSTEQAPGLVLDALRGIVEKSFRNPGDAP